MPAVGRCDNAVCGRESMLRPVGINYRMPAGWSVIADGPVKSRSVELLACSESCTTALYAMLPPSVKARLFTKTAAGECEILPANLPVPGCDICFHLGFEECAVHGA